MSIFFFGCRWGLASRTFVRSGILSFWELDRGLLRCVIFSPWPIKNGSSVDLRSVIPLEILFSGVRPTHSWDWGLSLFCALVSGITPPLCALPIPESLSLRSTRGLGVASVVPLLIIVLWLISPSWSSILLISSLKSARLFVMSHDLSHRCHQIM